ncbi:MAG: glutathione S-transferase family protein [Pseudomonadales bacterium]|nr:glutathione S-transferase family protein [Pseudomonadales bacterium]
MIPRITLYTFTMSPFAEKVHCYLQYKQLPFNCYFVNPLRIKKDLPLGHQVPALSVGEETRTDSTPIGLWLDELFPEHPKLLPNNSIERNKVLEIDQWISHHLIPGNFRNFPGTGISPRRILNAWRLGQVLHKTCHGGMPLTLQASWPLVLGNVRFLKDLRAMTDQTVPLKEANAKLRSNFIEKLEGGPYLGGLTEPTLADLGAFPQFVAPYMVGLSGAEEILEYPEIIAWLNRVRTYLTDTPPLIPNVALKREFPGDPNGDYTIGKIPECSPRSPHQLLSIQPIN